MIQLCNSIDRAVEALLTTPSDMESAWFLVLKRGSRFLSISPYVECRNSYAKPVPVTFETRRQLIKESYYFYE